MEKIKLITDSSANEKDDHSVCVVPLSISLNGKDFVDDQKLNLHHFLTEMKSSQEAGKTACPNIQEWLDALQGSRRAIIVTMTSAMSGTFASALQAKKIYLEQHPLSQIIVVDSRSAGPELAIILVGIKKMLAGNYRFVDLEQKIAEYRLHTHLLFILQSLHNLSLNGRVSPAVARIAGMLKINLLGTANKEGKLALLAKARGIKRALRDLLKQMKADNYHGGEVIIDHCQNEKDAQKLREAILTDYPQAQVQIRPMQGLCSFYAEPGGLMVGFHE